MTALDFNGRRMRTASTATSGVVSSDTVLVFEQIGGVVSACYGAVPGQFPEAAAQTSRPRAPRSPQSMQWAG